MVARSYTVGILGTVLGIFNSCSQADFLAKEKSKNAPATAAVGSEDSSVKDDEIAPQEEPVVDDDKKPVKEPPAPVEETKYITLKPASDVIADYSTATSVDQADIASCLFNLSGHPFDLTSVGTTFRRIEFDKITGTLAIALDDRKATAEPQIVLIRALETIGSELIFHLMNPNAYYCIKNLDDVGTDYDIHLHCQARVSENVRWTDTKYKTTLPVAVEESGVYLSPNKTKKLTHEKPAGVTCISGR